MKDYVIPEDKFFDKNSTYQHKLWSNHYTEYNCCLIECIHPSDYLNGLQSWAPFPTGKEWWKLWMILWHPGKYTCRR